MELNVAVTILDVAKRVGVTMTTVSKVLNNKPSGLKISQATRAKIFEAAQALTYRPSFSARALARAKTFSLGFICGDIHTPYYAELASKALKAAETRGYHLVMSLTEWNFQKERDCLDLLLGGKVDGVFMVAGGLQPGTSQYEYVLEKKFPVVISNAKIPGLSCVRNDWTPGMEQAVGHLKRSGYDRILFVGYPLPPPLADTKNQAFEQACGIHQVQGSLQTVTSNLNDARELGIRLAGEPARPSALIAYSDYIATGLISGLREGGLDVPRDMKVIGIDGTEMGQFYHPPLTTITGNIEKHARTTVDLLVNLIEKPEMEPKEIILATELIVRKSA